MKKVYYLLLSSFLFFEFACSNSTSTSNLSKEDGIENNTEQTSENFLGDFVTEYYKNREDGYDWTVVRILQNELGELSAEISSRSDLKRPSCRWATQLDTLDEQTLVTSFMDATIFFKVKGDSLWIEGDSPEADEMLHFYCNGGASLKNHYTRIHEPLDESQIKNFTFDQTLSLQGIDFDIKATEQNPFTILEIKPHGLEIDNSPVNHKIDGAYIRSEIEDLNSDGWPEILIYFNSYDQEMKAFLIGYSVNNGKSMSIISMPEMTEEQKEGFRGQDEFAIVETSLIRRFRTYQLDGKNWTPTGKIKQIQYKLRNGESSREFYVVNVSEY
ncbi:hypothetical protein JYB62_00640 [Algoriphagus lutimaris]|uniref:hypothetical protein n=1 Tax=Algoriphagus lutimaris TaxID=613197 RepID=UPI00196BABD2|nr:hypothetical protein [Algoriphagus lutimaris]MBN3518492.1 hypothetical protein [Algoriphagus lutimaris]